MGDSGLPEFEILGVLLGCPVYGIAMVLQGSYLARRRISWSQRRALLVVVIVGSVTTACVVGSALRVAVPPQLMRWPGNFGDWPYMFLGVIYIPALLAAAAIFPLFTWAAVRSISRSPTTR